MPEVIQVVTLQQCKELAPRLRQHDLLEIQASRPGVPPLEILIECVQVSTKTFAVVEEGRGCIAIFGVRTVGESGVPWMLASEELFDNHSRVFIKNCKNYVEELNRDYRHCFNYVAIVNVKAQRWLKWLGYVIRKDITRTVNGVDFHPFTFQRTTNV